MGLNNELVTVTYSNCIVIYFTVFSKFYEIMMLIELKEGEQCM